MCAGICLRTMKLAYESQTYIVAGKMLAVVPAAQSARCSGTAVPAEEAHLLACRKHLFDNSKLFCGTASCCVSCAFFRGLFSCAHVQKCQLREHSRDCSTCRYSRRTSVLVFLCQRQPAPRAGELSVRAPRASSPCRNPGLWLLATAHIVRQVRRSLMPAASRAGLAKRRNAPFH